jgi:hypothetical protein
MKIELTNEDLQDLIKNEYFVNCIATELVRMKKDNDWINEFDKQLIKAFEEAQKTIIAEYINEYYATDPKNRIIKALEEMDKKQIINLLK